MPVIRSAQGNDKDKVLRLLNGVFKEQQRSATMRGDQYWNWKFNSSPFGQSILTVAEEEGEIIAVDHLWPWEFNIRGVVHRAYQPCDSVVHPNFRGKHLFKCLRLYNLDVARGNSPSFMFNFPNLQSKKANLSLGWSDMGKIPWLVRIIRPFSAINGALKSNRTGPVLIDDAYSINVSQLESLNKEYINYNGFIKPHRRLGYFEWRYLQHPSRFYGMINVEKGKDSSSAIFTISDNGSYKEMLIVELLGCPGITLILLKRAIEIAEKMDVSVLAMMQNCEFDIQSAWRLGFINYKIKGMVVLPLDLRFEIMLQSFKNWSMFACLHDSV